jgi:glycosyltransferase involved in cell wall biosynthesis
MALGVPVAVSTAPSLVEVVGEAAPALDPRDVSAWAREMSAMGEPGPGRDARIARGLERAAEFSWTRAAGEHERVLFEAAGSAG